MTKPWIAATIRQIRTERGIGMNRLADMAGVSRGTVPKIEAGCRVSVDVAERILSALGYELDVMLKADAMTEAA